MSMIGDKRSGRTAGMLALISALCLSAAPARAGFEWNPPPAAAPATNTPAVAAVPLTPVVMDSSPISATPMPMMSPPPPPPADVMPPVAAPPVAAMRAMPPPKPSTAADSMASDSTPLADSNPALPMKAGALSSPVDDNAPAWAAPETAAMPDAAVNPAPVMPTPAVAATNDGTFKDVQGFGRDLPLALVMHQIVPADYAFSFAPDVKPGMPVSWQGGRPWNIVLQEALEPAKLVAVISNKTVRIQPLSAPRPAAPVLPPDTLAGGPVPATPAQADADTSWRSNESPQNPDDGAPPPPTPAPQHGTHYSEAELAAIGGNSVNYHPSYPRHVPAVHGQQPAPDTSVPADTGKAPDAAADNAAPMADSVNVPSPPPAETSSAPLANGSQPLSLTDKMAPETPAALDINEPTGVGKVMDMHAIGTWQAAKGASLHDTLIAWCNQAGVDLIWEAQQDYTLRHTINANGTFADAITKILTAYNDSKPRPVGKLHPNLPNGPSVLIIENPGGGGPSS